MRRLWILLLAFTILVYLTGCGLPQNVKTQKQEALKIAQTIPSIPAYYSPYTGHQLVATKISIWFDGYDSTTGRPYFNIGFDYIDPNPTHFLWFYHHLGYQIPKRLEHLVPNTQGMGGNFETDDNYNHGYYAGSTSEGLWQNEFTLLELQQATDLVWK